jgi:hypothetical protein
MKTKFITIALAMLGLASCRKDSLDRLAETTAESAADRAPTVQFNATYTTQPEIVAFTAPMLTLSIPGSGKANQLGNSSMHSNSWVNTGVLPFAQSGDMTFTAANGSTLFGTYSGTAVPTIDAEGHHLADFAGSFAIMGGTGHLEGFRGSGTYAGRAELADLNVGTIGAGEIVFTGRLNKPNN